MPATYFDDEGFLNLLASLMVKDAPFLKACGGLLTSKDFKPKSSKTEGNGLKRWIVARIALAHFEKYREPVRQLLVAELLEHCSQHRIQGDKKEELIDFGKRLLKKRVTAVTSITDKVLQFKRETLKANAVQKLIALQNEGKLTDEKWQEISQEALQSFSNKKAYVSDFLKSSELEKRIDRRLHHQNNRFPVLFIDPFDVLVKGIARGHLGLILAPWKRGKSLMLLQIAVAYVLQRLNVLFITLEDPPQDVEDRFDSAITHLPLKKIGMRRKMLRERFNNFKRLTRARLKIYDGTEQQMTVAKINDVWEEERNKGFTADVIIVDYDDEIRPLKKQQERRFEFAEIYRDLRLLAASKNAIVWTAAQTRRGTSGLKILTGDHLAEDVSKARKVMLAIGLGQGDWGEDSMYLFVAAHKFDRQHVGCNIMTDKERMLIYSREKTWKAKKNPDAFLTPKEEE